MKTQMSVTKLLLMLLVLFGGLHAAKAYYDPSTQRWLNRDPIGENGGINLYEFARNNAQMNIDPNGEAAFALPFAIELPALGEALAALAAIGIQIICQSEEEDDCANQWREARENCRRLLSSPNPPRAVTGGYTDIENCARGLVSEDCGGNPVSYFSAVPPPIIRPMLRF